MRKTKKPGIQLKSRLILIFALISLIPTISLVLVSQIIVSQSIDRWEDLSEDLMELLVLPMVENAMRIASEPAVISTLAEGLDFSEMELSLSEGYILNIYDIDGSLVFSSDDSPIPDVNLESL